MSASVAAQSKIWVCAARLKELRVWIPPGDWLCVSCEYYVLLGTGLCEGPIPLQKSPTRGGVSEWFRDRNIKES